MVDFNFFLSCASEIFVLCTFLSSFDVSVDDISIDNNEKPNRIYTTYNETFEDFSNIYTTNKNDVHFLVGPKVKQITPQGWFYWDED